MWPPLLSEHLFIAPSAPASLLLNSTRLARMGPSLFFSKASPTHPIIPGCRHAGVCQVRHPEGGRRRAAARENLPRQGHRHEQGRRPGLLPQGALCESPPPIKGQCCCSAALRLHTLKFVRVSRCSSRHRACKPYQKPVPRIAGSPSSWLPCMIACGDVVGFLGFWAALSLGYRSVGTAG